MPRYIDAEDLREKMYHEAFETDSEDQRWDSGCWIRYKMFERNIEQMPTAEVVSKELYEQVKYERDALQEMVDKRKVGKWINDKGLYKCSACNELWTVGWASCIPIKQMYKEVRYCPHCGAKMVGNEDYN